MFAQEERWQGNQLNWEVMLWQEELRLVVAGTRARPVVGIPVLHGAG